MLETLGVPVFGFGTDEFPAFYRRSSGLPVDRRYDSITELAAAVRRLHFSLGLGTGVLIANPIPIADEMASGSTIARSKPLSEAAARRIRGRDVTPFLLDRMRAVTGGESVRANVACCVTTRR